jgi:peptide deformylase
MSMKTIELKIKTYPARILRKKVTAVKKIIEEERYLLSRMAQIMYDSQGVGLAANQVGIDKSMLVADPGNRLYKLINPKIVKRQGKSILEEGCLSVPDVCLKIRRAKKVIVQAQDEEGRPITVEAEGLFSHILQHEIDHLNGKLIIDRVSFFAKLMISKKINRLRRSNGKLCESEKKSCKLQL